jgi:hypothetical protein
MNCPRCSAELPDSATFCQKCGSSLRPNSFSYLPAGTPNWPTTIPAEITGALSPFVRSATTPTSLTTQPLQPGEAAHFPAAQGQVKPRKSPRSTLLMFGVLLLSALIGGGMSLGILWANGQLFPNNSARTAPLVIVPSPTAPSATSPTPTATQQGNQLPTPASFQTKTITNLGVSVKFPSDWQQIGPQPTSANDLEVALVPPQQLGIALFIKRISASNSASLANPAAANQQNLTAFSNVQGVNNLHSTATSQPTIAGVSWIEQDASFTSDQGDNYHFSTIAVQHNKLYYMIYFYTPDVYHDEALQKYIQPMLTSFKFLS